MKRIKINFFLIFIFFTTLVKYSIAQTCVSYYEQHLITQKYFSSLVSENLFNETIIEMKILKNLYKYDIKSLSSPKYEPLRRLIKMNLSMNKYTIAQINEMISLVTLQLLKDNSTIKKSTTRGSLTINKDFLESTLRTLNSHPIASNNSTLTKFGRNGMCFARAFYLHLMLLRSGVPKENIKKIWIIGEFSKRADPWIYHVGTLVKLDSGDWYVLDTEYINPETGKMDVTTPQSWYRYFKMRADYGDLRLFISDPEKFGPSAGKYTRKLLETSTSEVKNTNYYNSFFKTFLQWFRTNRPVLD